jgi:hypothetical protein
MQTCFGALATSVRNKKYILCKTDSCTKYVELVAIPNKEAETVADVSLLTENVVLEFQPMS